MADSNKDAQMHSAGATVRHSSPFHDLISHRNTVELTPEFLHEWAIPYYMKIASYDSAWPDTLKEAKASITREVCLALLGDFNWRTRLVGTYFAAVKGYFDMQDIIGIHFLKSEVCCVGHIYALVLAYFNNEKSLHYLNTYLNYYLTKPELYFDQEYAISALIYLDKTNGTEHAQHWLPKWHAFTDERQQLALAQNQEIAKIIEVSEGQAKAEQYLASIATNSSKADEERLIDFFKTQLKILHSIS